MDTKQLIRNISAKLDFDNLNSEKMLDAFVSTVTSAALNDDNVAIPSFGTFEPIKADEEIVSDHVTGKKMLLPPQISFVFTPAAMLRKKLFSDGTNN